MDRTDAACLTAGDLSDPASSGAAGNNTPRDLRGARGNALVWEGGVAQQ